MPLMPLSATDMAMTIPPYVAGLTDEEKRHLMPLNAVYLIQQGEMRLAERYYLGTQIINNLRIAIPQELEFLRTIVGWPAFAVDPYVERLIIDSFRVHGAIRPDSLLTDLWTLNNMDAQLPMATGDALSMGRGYWLIGVDADGYPKITVESPLNMAVRWNGDSTAPTSAWQAYWQDGRYHGVLMLPNSTTVLTTDDGGDWQVLDRDEHHLGFVPLVRMPHAPRTNARDGRSAITPAIRSVTDSACRDLLGLEVSREFYSIPRVLMLGASEADFVNTDGSVKTAWETLITRFNAFQRDDEGNVPTVHQLQPYDPSIFTKLIDMRASMMASMVAAPPQDLGLYTSGNPTSSDAVDAMETRRARRARLYQRQFGISLAEVLQTALRVMNHGDLPTQYSRIIPEWVPVEEVNPVTASQSIMQQIQSGALPATSDVALKRLGYTAIERMQIEQERQNANDNAQAQAIIQALNGGMNNDRTGGNGPIDAAHRTDHSNTGTDGTYGGVGPAGIGSGVGVRPGSVGVGVGDHGGGLG